MQEGGGRRTDKRAPITIFCEQEHTRTRGNFTYQSTICDMVPLRAKSGHL